MISLPHARIHICTYKTEGGKKNFLFLQKDVMKILKSIQVRFFFNFICSKVFQFAVIVYL